MSRLVRRNGKVVRLRATYGEGSVGRLLELSQAFMNHCEVLDMVADEMKAAKRSGDDERIMEAEEDFTDTAKETMRVFQKVQRHLVKITKG